MKAIRVILITACCITAAYGYWGAFTVSGNERYEGMAALLPFYMMLGSVGVLLILGLYYLVISIRRK